MKNFLFFFEHRWYFERKRPGWKLLFIYNTVLPWSFVYPVWSYQDVLGKWSYMSRVATPLPAILGQNAVQLLIVLLPGCIIAPPCSSAMKLLQVSYCEKMSVPCFVENSTPPQLSLNYRNPKFQFLKDEIKRIKIKGNEWSEKNNNTFK